MQWKQLFFSLFWDETSQTHILEPKWGDSTVCFKSYEKHHMQGRPPTQPPSRPGCNRTHSWRAVEESTVSIHGSSLAPQLCHFQSIAFRKLASTLQFEMKSLFCCGAHSVYNDLTLKKHACFSEAFSPVAANYIMCSCSKYSLNGFRGKLHSHPKQELRWCRPIF